MVDLLGYDFLQRALVAAAIVGLVAPMVGVFLVQRRLALIGDGIGHVALAGVAVGLLTNQAPVVTALVAAAAAAVVVELIRSRGRTGGDTALAIIFYGGIAAGVALISASPKGSPANLTSYLFGAITTVSTGDLTIFAVMGAGVAAVVALLWSALFAAAQDEEYARAAGLPVLALNLVLGVLVAVTVVVAMRVVGLLLISALMVVPNATGQVLGRSFAGAARWAVLIGVLSAVGGVLLSYQVDTPSGATIVLLAVAAYVVAALGAGVAAAVRRRGHGRGGDPVEPDHQHGPGCGHDLVLHEDHVDYVHSGHRHTELGALHPDTATRGETEAPR